MKVKDFAYFVVLALLAAFIWVRNMDWVSQMDDTLPILVAIPLFVWLEWPWRLSTADFRLSQKHVCVGALLFVIGILANITLALSLAWSLLLWAWITERVDPEMRSRLLKLMILPIMAFPWVTLDAHSMGWWFRLTGASCTGEMLSNMGFNVVQNGTELLVNGLPISVEAACAGLNTLQSMLIAGSVMAYLQLGHHPVYWLNLPFLFVMAWVANTLRIISLALAALWVSPDFAMGPFHDAGGWLVLMVMFALCWAVFSVEQKLLPPSPQAN